LSAARFDRCGSDGMRRDPLLHFFAVAGKNH